MSMSNTQSAGTWKGICGAVGARLLMISSMCGVLCRWCAGVPEPGPGRKAWQHHRRRVLRGWPRPTRESRVLRPFEHIAAVEEVFLTANEIPDAITAFVGVHIAGGLDDPLPINLVLAPAVDPPGGVRRILQVDYMPADQMD